MRGYGPGYFSFNVKGGRCENCEGQGSKKVEMYFLPDIWVECEECKGTRYSNEVLEIEYNDKNISEVLNFSVKEAFNFFKDIPAISSKLEFLVQVGLDYLKLGQPAPTLSGGEAQRIKLAKELGRRSTGKTIYILDEPTYGLHFEDTRKLIIVLKKLVALGNTVIAIEHNSDFIKTADWIIDLGPEGGVSGGQIIAQGTVEEITKNKISHTGKFLK
jgi:excinuclease ABC subunit A